MRIFDEFDNCSDDDDNTLSNECPECHGALTKSFADGKLECPQCVQIKSTPELREEARQLERANRPRRRFGRRR